MKKSVLSTSLMVAALALSGTALTHVTSASAMANVSELTAQLEAEGFTVTETETEDGVIEVEMVDANGEESEAYLRCGVRRASCRL